MRKTYIFLCLFLILSAKATAQIQENWPEAGLTAYLDAECDTVIVRNAENKLVAQMELDVPSNLDLQNVTESIVFSERFGKRFGYLDVNRNGKQEQIYEDTFETYSIGSDLNNDPDCAWEIWGEGALGKFINARGDNKFLHINFDGTVTTSVMPFGIFLKNDFAFAPDIDFSQSSLEFDIYTTLSSSIRDIIATDLFLYDSDDDVYESIQTNTANLETFPATGGEWTSIQVDKSDFTVLSSLDITRLSKINVLFLQKIQSISVNGVLYIDNIRIGENHVQSLTSLDTTLEYLGDSSQSVYPGQTVTLYFKAQNTGDIRNTVTSLKVFDPSFSWDDPNASCIYDSLLSGEDRVSHIGWGESEQFSFTITIPTNASPGTYHIFATIADNDTGTIIDTTGPDVNFNDPTICAYLPAFTVEDYSGPVALFDFQTVLLPSGTDVELDLDASQSFHSLTTQNIVAYEWDIDNDGIYDYTQTSPQLHLEFSGVDLPFELPVALRVTDDSFPQQTMIEHHIITFAENASLQVTLDGYDNDGLAPAKCVLYDIHGNSTILPVDNSGVALWQLIPEGNYTLVVYEYDDSRFSSIKLRGMHAVNVNGGTLNEIDSSNNSPSIGAISPTYLDTGKKVITSHQPKPGRLIKFSIPVYNASSYDQVCRIKMFFDKECDSIYDIECNPTPQQIVPAGQTIVFTQLISFPRPVRAEDVYEIFYTILLETEFNGKFFRTDETPWAKLCEPKDFTAARLLLDPFALSGITWWNLEWPWQSGLRPENVDVLDEGNGVIELRTQDYSGVGAQVETDSDNFHYGVYKATMKMFPVRTEMPEGVVFSFFHYWEQGVGNLYEMEEIDVEFRSMDISDNDAPSYVSFSVHNRQPYDPVLPEFHTVTYRCPVYDIDRYHVYEFRWKPGEVAFYIDGELAYDNGTPAIVNDQSVTIDGLSFAGRVPVQSANIICNLWSGKIGNAWAGTPPQGRGDIVGYVTDVNYEPVILKELNRLTTDERVLNIDAYNNYTIQVWATDDFNAPWSKVGELNSPQGFSSLEYHDNDGFSGTRRFYQLKYDR